jgi:hypothetical protein
MIPIPDFDPTRNPSVQSNAKPSSSIWLLG